LATCGYERIFINNIMMLRQKILLQSFFAKEQYRVKPLKQAVSADGSNHDPAGSVAQNNLSVQASEVNHRQADGRGRFRPLPEKVPGARLGLNLRIRKGRNS